MSTRLLLVDDEHPFLEALSRRLTKRGIDVVGALSGQEAIRKIDQDQEIDVVVLDVKMPGMDGITTLKELKAKAPLVEVILLTGHATVESAIQGMKQGAFDYLMKPCDMDVLMAKIADAKATRSDRQRKIAAAMATHRVETGDD